MLYSCPHNTCDCKSENFCFNEICVSEKESLKDLAKMGDKSSVSREALARYPGGGGGEEEFQCEK